jgi:hypothetical protein
MGQEEAYLRQANDRQITDRQSIPKMNMETITYSAAEIRSRLGLNIEACKAFIEPSPAPAAKPRRSFFARLHDAIFWRLAKARIERDTARAMRANEVCRRLAAESDAIEAASRADFLKRDNDVLKGICEDLRKRATEAEQAAIKAEAFMAKSGGRHALAFYRADWSRHDDDIANAIGCNRSSVVKWRQKLGAPRCPKKAKNKA